MPWYKPKDKEPINLNEEYFIRNGGDKYTGWWDKAEGEFFTVTDGKMATFAKDQYPNIEWWDEEEPNQEVLWDEIRNDMTGGAFAFPRPDVVDEWANKYQLIRK